MATHPVDGDLSTHIDACVPGYRFEAQGLAGCALDTQMLGNHSVTFFLSASSLAASSNTAARTILVHPVCSEEEALCADLTCSSSGLCLDGAAAVQQNSPPQLAFGVGEQATVYVPRGTEYEFCGHSGIDANAGRLCEKGPAAYDEDDSSIPERVLACPPMDCLALGCPGHELLVKGLQGCGVDTVSASIGTSFNISFVVLDSHRPPSSASIQRTVVVISPCASSEVYCPDRAVQCATSPCALRDGIEEVEVYNPPELQLELSGVAADSHELVSSPGSVRNLKLWSLCAKSLPLDFTHVCGVANQGDLAAITQSTCPHSRNSKCALSVESFGASSDPLVALIRRDRSTCPASGCDVLCSSDVLLWSLLQLEGALPHCSPLLCMHSMQVTLIPQWTSTPRCSRFTWPSRLH